MRCNYCGTENGDSSKFCHGCGKPLEPEIPSGRKCPFCGKPVKDDAIFCRNCGEKIIVDDDKEQHSIPVAETMVLDRSLLHKSAEFQEDAFFNDLYDERQDSNDLKTADTDPMEDFIMASLEESEGEAIIEPSLDHQVHSSHNTCPTCGRPLREGIKFCGYCGTPVAESSVEKNTASQTESVHIPVEELKKLKELLDDEIISKEEFDVIKKKLIGIE